MTACVSDSHGNVLLEGLQYLWTNDLFLDYTLVAEGETIHVHKVVMAACSDYFRVLLCGEMCESKEKQVVLKDIRANTLRSLVKFAYSGELSIDNIEEIVSGARYFQMPNALDLCGTFLTKMLTVENVLYVLNLAEKYVLDDVHMTAEEFLLEKFDELPKDSFLNLSEKQMMRVLGRDSLHIFSEYSLFENTVIWINWNSDLKQETIFGLLDKVRFPLMSDEELFSVSQTKVMTSPKCQGLLKEAHDYHKDVLKQPLMQNSRTQVRGDRSYVFGAQNKLFCSKFKGKKFAEEMREHDGRKFWFEHLVAVDNFLYVYYIPKVDDPSLFACFERYDPRFNVWKHLPSLNVSRKDFPLVVFERNIYAFGGVNERTVEVFFIQTNKWEMRSPINFENAGSAGVVFDEKIYVTGGANADFREYYCSVNCYTPVTDSWESMAPMIQARYKHHMAAVNGRVYAFGGMCEGSATTVEYYSPEVNQWTLTDAKIKLGVCGLIVDNVVKIVSVGSGNVHPLGVCLMTYDLEKDKTAQPMWVLVSNTFRDRRFIRQGCRTWLKIPCICLVLPHKLEMDNDEWDSDTFTDTDD